MLLCDRCIRGNFSIWAGCDRNDQRAGEGPKRGSLKGDVKRNNFPTTGGQQDFCLGIQPL